MTKKVLAFEGEEVDFGSDQSTLNEEENHFFHTLADFEELVNNYGFEAIMDNISDEVYIQMFDFFMPDLEGEEENA